MKINKKFIISFIIITIILIALIIGILKVIGNKYNENNIEIIQLSPHSGTQMMGYIIYTNNNQMIVIDGGTTFDTENLLKYIKEHENKVNYWFLTHAHNDHLGAFTEIVNKENIEIENIYVSLNDKEWYEKNEFENADFSRCLIDTLNNEKIKDIVISPKLNDTFEIDGIKVEILGIRNPEIISNPGNEQSMVIKFDTGKTKLLILGDTGIKSSEKLLKNQKQKLKSDIVQMSHHGQRGATKELYEEIKPQICLWPTTNWLWNNDNGNGENSGKWETLKTRQWMNELEVEENYVAKDGDVLLKIK